MFYMLLYRNIITSLCFMFGIVQYLNVFILSTLCVQFI